MLSAALRRASGRLARPIVRNGSTKIVAVEAEVSMAYGTRFLTNLSNAASDAVLVAFYAWFIAYNARRVVGRSHAPMDYEVRFLSLLPRQPVYKKTGLQTGFFNY